MIAGCVARYPMSYGNWQARLCRAVARWARRVKRDRERERKRRLREVLAQLRERA